MNPTEMKFGQTGEKKYFVDAWVKNYGDRTVCHLGLRYEFAARRGL